MENASFRLIKIKEHFDQIEKLKEVDKYLFDELEYLASNFDPHDKEELYNRILKAGQLMQYLILKKVYFENNYYLYYASRIVYYTKEEKESITVARHKADIDSYEYSILKDIFSECYKLLQNLLVSYESILKSISNNVERYEE